MEKTFSGQILCSCAFGANIRSYTKQRARHGTPFLQSPPLLRRASMSPPPPPPRRAIFRLPSETLGVKRYQNVLFGRGAGVERLHLATMVFEASSHTMWRARLQTGNIRAAQRPKGMCVRTPNAKCPRVVVAFSRTHYCRCTARCQCWTEFLSLSLSLSVCVCVCVCVLVCVSSISGLLEQSGKECLRCRALFTRASPAAQSCR